MINLIKKLNGKALALILVAFIGVAFAVAYIRAVPSWNEIYTHLGVDEPYLPIAENELRATFFSVGNADCALICSSGFTMINDTGAPSQSSELIKLLKKNSITTVDLLAISHADSDHAGNAVKILKSFNVKRVIVPDCGDLDLSDDEPYNALIEYAVANGIPVDSVRCGDCYEYGRVKITVLAPITQLNSVNNNSVVLRLNYDKSSFVFTGDAETGEQKSLLQGNAALSADIIKIPHHGRKSAYCEEFLDAVSPNTAVIQCGDTDEYKVSPKLLMYLESKDIKCLRTDLCGNITVVTVGDGNYSIITEK